ncbi:L-threonylcarbamoyladenylate synthase [Methanobacterium paludis]|uniref:L-threonylcarbamoyladenylate synthase n=1 Tax=Methanobacterium paludis (strain DSM 25820 / JCM 18151 / SWAN1) TaxID=868131 RepID=F6D3Y7_METPW|nr:L-threonylcarbamoyladenylate synthase [Methanobacterium paludis]AEG18789.1 Sua5/YciO/YrdC/YwlC family protein [Methanobacterium paludis]
MKIVKINSKKPENEKIALAKKILRNGGIVVYPTDTVYGIGANIFDEKAVQKVYFAKKRSRSKPISICLSRIEDIKEVACIDRDTERIARKILPGPFTLILKKKEGVSPLLTAGEDKIGVRIPDSRICKELSEDFPITTTSANISGMKVPESADGVVKQLGDSVDLILDAGVFEHAVPSTVIDMTVFPLKILRKGSKTVLNEIFK